MNRLVVFIFLVFSINANAQKDGSAFLRMAMPSNENNAVRSARQFISGATCKSCELTVNDEPVKVYPTGAFAHQLKNIKPGVNTFTLVAKGPGKTSATKKLTYRYTIPVPDTVKEVSIASIQVIPEGNLYVAPGDQIKLRVKALPGAKLIANENIQLHELPTDAANPVPGIYQAEFTVSDTDRFSATRVPVTLTASGKTVTRLADDKISMLSDLPSDMVVTKGRLAYLLYGLGGDRLGGSKIGYIDSLIPLRVLGKVGNLFKVRLSKYRTAYIPDDVVSYLPKGSFTPSSLTSSWRVFGDSLYDYVQLGLSTRLPYQSEQLTDPSRVVVDVFGATNNTNWLAQLSNTKEIKNVRYDQLEDEVLRITIDLKHAQHWGHMIYYEGNRLVIRIRRQPASLELRNLRIAIDPGHGGGNAGTRGPAGSSEKELALAVSLKLRQALRLQGAKTLMTRVSETFVDNKERILMYRDSLPDLLVSLHFNSSGDPVNVSGTSTYYRHHGFRPLSQHIYARMLETGLNEFGVVGSFNFMLNSPTEYPNSLVEILFLSNPADEMLILDEKFQQEVADKIVAGIKDFLERCKQD